MKNILTKIRNAFLKFIDIFYKVYLRYTVKNKNFSIISNNCWAGRIYQDLNIPYNTPTVGLFFYASDFIKFLRNLKQNLSMDLKFVNESKYETANKYRLSKNKFYPIGVINEIEIHFLHYQTELEAFTKWNKRKKRVNLKNIYIKMCDQNLCTIEDIQDFNKLEYKNKVFFSSKDISGIPSLVYLKKYKNKPYVGDLYTSRWQYRLHFNVAKWLNS